MYLYSLQIEGFRQFLDTTIYFSDATFLIGQNNTGKSSALKALEYVLNDYSIPPDEFLQSQSDDDQQNICISNEITLTAEFRNLPMDSKSWRGFKGRILNYDISENSSETGNKIIYRKKFTKNNNKPIFEILSLKQKLKDEFLDCENLNDFKKHGLSEEILKQNFPKINNWNKALTDKQKEQVFTIDEALETDPSNEELWINNPGGIPGNVLSKLPKFLLIPAQDKTDEIVDKKGTLQKTLNELFHDVRECSDNYQKAKEYLEKLTNELDPGDNESAFGKLMSDLNGVLGDIFPSAKIFATADLSGPENLSPSFDISMSSNINTRVNLQGTGMIRSAVFALLRFRTSFLNKKSQKDPSSPLRPLIIGFEEPEIYLHPHAANQMRDVIYELAQSEYNQIVCSTHSPYMIDLAKTTGQILNLLQFTHNIPCQCNGSIHNITSINANPFNTSQAFIQLCSEDKTYLKMILKLDDYLARVFFAKKILIIEGDTEEIVLRETFTRLPDEVKNDILFNWQIVNARGKATIISLIKYFKAFNLDITVMHDKDTGIKGAEKFNPIIKGELDNDSQLYVLENCLETVLGYDPPSSEKPFKAYKKTLEWDDNFSNIPNHWKKIFKSIFESSFQLTLQKTSSASK